jgi:hypothetical protein
MEIKALIQKYADGYRHLKEHMDSVPDEVVHFKPNPDAWSVCEIMVHLADSEVNAYVRGRKIIAEPGSRLEEYDQMRWSESLFYQEMDHRQALELFGMLRHTMVAMLQKLDEEVWHQYAIHPESGKITLLDWIQLYIDHVENHIHQMNRNLYDFRKTSS